MISVKEMLKKPFGAVLSILQSWEFSKISPQNPGNGISETLDSKIFWGSMPPYPLEFLASSVPTQTHFRKASAGPDSNIMFAWISFVLTGIFSTKYVINL